MAVTINGSTGIAFADNDIEAWGSSDDLKIYHSGSESFFANTHGSLTIKNTGNINLYTNNTEDSVVCTQNGDVKLYYNGGEKLRTYANGCDITGSLHVDELRTQDNQKLSLGTNDDLQIWHDGSNSIIKDAGTGSLKVITNQLLIRETDGNANMLSCNEDGAVELYYDDVKKLETTSAGVAIVNSLIVDGTDRSAAHASNQDFVVGNTSQSSTGMALVTQDGGYCSIVMSDGQGDKNKGLIAFNHADDTFKLVVDPASGMDTFTMTSNGAAIGGNNWDTTSTSAGINLYNIGTIVVRRNGNMSYYKTIDTGGYNSHVFLSANTTVGTIVVSSGGTAYNTSSDYRLKENVSGITDGITRVKQLKPSKFNWISDDTNTPVDGFLAHEVSSLVPEAITGEKDEVATEADSVANISIGDPVYQQIDQAKLVPLLTAALQEAITKIETLETKVAALEAA